MLLILIQVLKNFDLRWWVPIRELICEIFRRLRQWRSCKCLCRPGWSSNFSRLLPSYLHWFGNLRQTASGKSTRISRRCVLSAHVWSQGRGSGIWVGRSDFIFRFIASLLNCIAMLILHLGRSNLGSLLAERSKSNIMRFVLFLRLSFGLILTFLARVIVVLFKFSLLLGWWNLIAVAHCNLFALYDDQNDPMSQILSPLALHQNIINVLLFDCHLESFVLFC